jgi:cysteine desulfurase/selenocysteine lyase
MNSSSLRNTGPASRERMPIPRPSFNLYAIRADFPALHQRIHGRPLVYLDSAATALKPHPVIEAVVGAYTRDCANVHRGVHTLADRASTAFEAARGKVARFIHARSPREVVFVRGATEAINLVAQSYARPRLRPGDEVLVTQLEHHSNLVPWQVVCQQTGARLVVVPVTERGEVEIEAFRQRLTHRTRVVAVAHASNVLGTVLPVRLIALLAHARGATVVVDGAQAVPHLGVDVQDLVCDFYAFSGHKLYGPTGIGVLYGREDLLSAMPPYQTGGEMILSVSFERTLYQDPPRRFEAGTPDIAGAIGLGAAVDYLERIGQEPREEHERKLLEHGREVLGRIPRVRLVGNPASRVGVLSFVLEGAHAHDIGTVADAHGVAIRTGQLCAEPLLMAYGLPAVARASVGIYNTLDDLEALGEAVAEAGKVLT